MFDWFTIILALLVAAIALFIIKAVRQTKVDIDNRLKHVEPAKRNEYAKKLAERIRSQDVSCTRCGRQAFALLGTGNKYKCHTCNFEFEGSPHMPADIE